MERSILSWVCVCALVALPVGGCSDETTATGGTGGSGDTGGDGGSGGMGGDAGSIGRAFPCTEAGIRAAIADGGGPHTFECDGAQTVATGAEIVIDNDVILDGEGNLTVSGKEDHRVFAVSDGMTVELNGLVVTEGASSGLENVGGGIYSLGTLTLTNSTVSGNTAAAGGGIFSSGIAGRGGDLTLNDSTVSGNAATGAGGGIENLGTLALNDSAVTGNTAPEGGGIFNLGTMTLTNSTVSGNSGTGIDTHFMAMLTNSTVSGNGASGAAIHNEGSPKGPFSAVLMITNSTVSGIISNDPVYGTSTVANSVLDGECNGAPVTSDGYNIESPGDTCGFDQPTDQAGIMEVQLDLGPLQDNGGPTMTHALGGDSVAIDRIPEGDCAVDADQRHVSRPRGDGCDVGAVEVDLACVGADVGSECTHRNFTGVCGADMCWATDCSELSDGINCLVPRNRVVFPGRCAAGSCEEETVFP